MIKPLRLQNAFLVLMCILSASHIRIVAGGDSELPQADSDLFAAMADEDIDAAIVALKAGANINALSPRGQQTPLMQSVLHGRTKMVKFCLDHGADVTIPERDGYTPMHGAGFQGRSEIAALLKQAGVPLRDVHSDGYEPAIRSCWGAEPRHTDAVEWFLANGVPLEEIYDKCMEMTNNPHTKAMLQKQKGGDEL
mmetsp:Transcript_13287/g.22703  ORF Transcript_13287/g.22703 Transcript_13287/m.22703 type:complete len:195 (+) Transcript_13287:118-702(+)|eukprot:CAMPEP_0183718798 /NCGR_PEP_ID=MMETSP0737-20130205/11965_1 /TAXON_ID=385413 /ORGANISM="Thalassiosira miniscula, Strain CCMP1093" /LENGTH=194 /DNA_ID=CAMNT_0025948417 /DNA_START=88 /DNA_END=672 /DNA_ORIENTATION=-